MKIATHNSGTGEQSGGWLSKLFSVFAKCQDKTLVEQYQCGVRLFDLRIRKNKKGAWVFSNGLWESKNPVGYALSDLNLAAYKAGEKAMVMVTYDGDCRDKAGFMSEVSSWDCYSWLERAEISVKKPKWRTLAIYQNIAYVNCFRELDWSSWHTLIPIPWLWERYSRKQLRECKESDKVYRMVDFVRYGEGLEVRSS